MSAAPELLTYYDLESELNDAVSMSEVACDLIENAQCAANRTASGYALTAGEMRLMSFSIYHANSLALKLKKKWDEVHDVAGRTRSCAALSPKATWALPN
ncbi:hypothetical protein [Mesorhizobium sp. A623]